MTIIHDERQFKVPFETLNNGDVFEWNKEFYIKTEGGEAVLLENGRWGDFPKLCLVKPVEAVLTIS